MQSLSLLEPVDYLLIGHLTCDITPKGLKIGGTASYAALTAQSLGLRVGIVTSWGAELPLDIFGSIQVANYLTERSTTFENIYTPEGRVQTLHHVAPRLDYHLVPEAWRNAPIVHLGPVAQEVEPALVRRFPNALVGLTPQGWLRTWDQAGCVYATEWPEASFMLSQADAAVLSIEDIEGDESQVEAMAARSRVLVITEGAEGARVYWNGDVRRYRPPTMIEMEATGAGDIFAAAFFTRLHATHDPWEAARFATQLAATSVTRSGLDSIPTIDEVQSCTIEVF